VASDCSDSVLHGNVRLLCPDGWGADPAELPFMLPPGEYLETDVVVTMPPGSPSGLYPIRAELAVTGSDAVTMPPAWRQVVEDVCIVSVGSPSGGEILRLISGPDEVTVNAGETARLAVTVGTDACADLAIEAHLISPWGTWEWLGPGAIGREMPASGTLELGFDVTPPVWVEAGQWWALIRVGCAGRLIYSPAVKVTVQ
jgi:alpha-mannosidase